MRKCGAWYCRIKHEYFWFIADGIPKLMSMHHLSITEFLEQYNGNRTIDLLQMDVEGAEYGIIEKLKGAFFSSLSYSCTYFLPVNYTNMSLTLIHRTWSFLSILIR